jgi:hypothetical protein
MANPIPGKAQARRLIDRVRLLVSWGRLKPAPPNQAFVRRQRFMERTHL